MNSLESYNGGGEDRETRHETNRECCYKLSHEGEKHDLFKKSF